VSTVNIDAVVVVAQAMQDLLQAGKGVALALTGDHLLVSPDYWTEQATFERVVADTVLEAGQRSVIFAAAPVHDGERAQCLLLQISLDSGLDLLRSPMQPDGALGDIEHLMDPGSLNADAPGFLLLQELVSRG